MTQLPVAAPDADNHVKQCLNCDTPVNDAYCPHCGQSTHAHVPSLLEYLHEFIGHYIAFEGKLASSLWRLFLLPGALTAHYLYGKRVRYIAPLRLYLTLSVIFFATLQLLAPASDIEHLGDKQTQSSIDEALRAGKAAADKQGPAQKAATKDDEELDFSHVQIGMDENFKLSVKSKNSHIQKRVDEFNQLDLTGKIHLLRENFFHYAPYAMFLLLPLFALGLQILYLKARNYYGEHLVFALHSNTFAYAILTLELIAGHFGWLWAQLPLTVWLIVYLPLAMRRVYRRSWFGTLLRWGALMFTYVIGIAVALILAPLVGTLL